MNLKPVQLQLDARQVGQSLRIALVAVLEQNGFAVYYPPQQC
jgi:hypothetical protein